MTLTLQEISDRFQIMDVLIDYCTAIDSNDIEALNQVLQMMRSSIILKQVGLWPI